MKSPFIDIPTTRIKGEKPFDQHYSFGFKVEKLFNYLSSRSRSQTVPSPKSRLKTPLVAYIPFIKIKVANSFFFKIEVANICFVKIKVPWLLTVPLLRSRFKIPLVADIPFIKIKVVNSFFVKIEVIYNYPLSRTRLKSPLVADSFFIKIKVQKLLGRRQFLRLDRGRR